MNHYGQLAMDHWRTHRPMSYAAITDPVGHFEALGEQAQAAITALRDEVLGPTRPGESLTDLQRRTAWAQRQAEEIVISDLILHPEEPTAMESDPALSEYYRQLAAMNAAMESGTSF